jgi:hypothetical protein
MTALKDYGLYAVNVNGTASEAWGGDSEGNLIILIPLVFDVKINYVYFNDISRSLSIDIDGGYLYQDSGVICFSNEAEARDYLRKNGAANFFENWRAVKQKKLFA